MNTINFNIFFYTFRKAIHIIVLPCLSVFIRGSLYRCVFLVWLLYGLMPVSLEAFGRNKVNVHAFKWQVVSTAHFDIHFTDESKPVVPWAAYYLEKAYDRVTAYLEVDIPQKTSYFILSNHNEFEENNIVMVGEGTGGVTEAFKNRVVIFNSGAQMWLDHVITHEFTHVAQFEVLYGGFWKSARLLKSPLYPLWFMEGLAEYSTGDIDKAQEDLYLRDAATSGLLYPLNDLHGFSHLKPHQTTLAYKQGGAAVRYLADTYGEDKLAQMLRDLRERFEISTILPKLIKKKFPEFNKEYLDHLTQYYAEQSKGLEEPEAYGQRLTAPDMMPVFNTNPVFSPDKRFLAYLTDKQGLKQVVLFDLKTGNERYAAGHQKSKLENIHSDGKALSFSPDSRWLAFAGEKEQRDYLYLYDTKRHRLRRIRTPFEHIRSPVFHPTESHLVIVGMTGGFNDLHEITSRGKLIRTLTNSWIDESDPAYSPDGQSLVYSQEVIYSADSLKTQPSYGRNLMLMNLVDLTTSTLTHLPGADTAPVFTPDGKSVIFVGEDEQQIKNLFRVELADRKTTQLTRVIGGNFSPDISSDGQSMVFVSYRRNSMDLYLAKPDLWLRAKSKGQRAKDQLSAGTGSAFAQSEEIESPHMGFAIKNQKSKIKNDEQIPLLAGQSRPYRLRASTDLFFPLFYYSSSEGLFLAMLWQASEYLGHHQIQTNLQYSSGNDFLDYSVQYQYKRFRPQFFLGSAGEKFYRDISRTQLRKESHQLAGVSFPFNRFDRIEGVLSTIYREDFYDYYPEFNFHERENYWAVSLVRDTSDGRYLSVTSGQRFRMTYQRARPLFGGTRNYKTHVFEYHRFMPTGRESTLAFRGLTGVSTGASPQSLRLGGIDRLRGYPRNGDEFQSTRYVMGNLEWRVPLRYMDSGVGLFPSLSLKALYGTLFVDVGYDWERSDDLNHLKATRIRNSVGAGFRIPAFVFQTYMVTLSIDAAKRTDQHNWSFYFSLGPEF